MGFALEFLGAPAGLDVELKPLAEAGDGFGLGVVGEDAGVDDGVIGAGEHVVCALTLWRRNAADVGDGPLVVAGDFAEDLAHVAVLANSALGGGRAVAELAVGLLETEDVLAVNVVAVGTELRGGEDLELHRAVVDHLGAVFFPIDRAGGVVGRDVEFVEDLLEDIGAARAIHGLGEVSLFNAMAAADAAVGVFNAVAGDTADTLACDGYAVRVGYEDRFADGHAGFGVAADAKIAVGAVDYPIDALGHRVEDGTELGVGVLRDRPLAILARVALGAERG